MLRSCHAIDSFYLCRALTIPRIRHQWIVSTHPDRLRLPRSPVEDQALLYTLFWGKLHAKQWRAPQWIPALNDSNRIRQSTRRIT